MLTGMAKWKSGLLVVLLTLAAAIAAIGAAEIYLRSRAGARAAIPFYNRLYPYVMFRPAESTSYVSEETFLMSHSKSRVYHYTNADGLRVPSMDYALPHEKPPSQLRIAVLGSSAVQLGSTYETTLPGSLRTVLRRRYPGRDIEVINGGITSCVSRQSIAHLLFTVAAYHPDIVILYDGVNDIGMPMTYESRPNFPYNFQALEAAWNTYRENYEAPLWRLALDRSYVAQAVRAKFGQGESGTQRPVVIGPNAIPAERFIRDGALVKSYVAEYLANWKLLVELAPALRYQPVCVLQPTGGLDREYAVPLTRRDFQLSEKAALEWIAAFDGFYQEADRQVDALRAADPGHVYLNLRAFLKPSKKYFWDLVHVYDETNELIAERILAEIHPLVESPR